MSSAVVLAIVFAAFIWAPPLVAVVAAAVAGATSLELSVVLSRCSASRNFGAAVIAALIVLMATRGAAVWAATMIAGCTLVAMVEIGRRRNPWPASLSIGWASVPLALAVILADFYDGRRLLILVVGPLCTFESTALMAGRRWAHRPIAPRISPGKTVEGTMAGVLATFAAAGVCWAIDVYDAKPAFSIAVLACRFGFAGDLAGSVAKRAASLKDPGHLMPGHGGMLDYVDGFLFVVPAVFVLRLFQPTLGTAP